MPIYLNSKQNISIPNDFDPDFLKNENFLSDPEMLFDRLPQPFHFINKILNKMLNNVYDIIDENFKRKILESTKLKIEETIPVSIFENWGLIQCIVEIIDDNNYLIAGLKNGLAILDIVSQNIIDKWENSEMDIITIDCVRLCQNIFILSTIDNNGTGGLLAVINNRLYSLKSFPGNKDGDKPCQVMSVCLDDNCGFVAVSYNQFKDNEQWVEVHKICKEAWIKELKIVGKTLEEYSAAQLENQATGSELGLEESSSILDRNGLRATGTTVIFKFKYLDSLGSCGTNNFSQIFKQLDSSGQVIGMGLNHCMSAEFVEILMNSYQNDYPNFVDSDLENNSNLLRTVNIRFSKVSGRLNNDVGALIKSESSIMFVWWSGSQHLLIYGINRTIQKTNESFTKPDSIKSFSSPIVTCELSVNNFYLAIGLQNGIFMLLDILSGITRTIKQISDTALKSIQVLNFGDAHFKNQIIPNATTENKAYFLVIDAQSRMFYLKYDSEVLLNDSSCTLISNEGVADSISRLSRKYNMVLSIYERNIIVLQDMNFGTKVLKVQLPEYTNILFPWQPIFGFLSKDGYLCIQVIPDQSEETLESGIVKQMTVIYKIKLETQNDDCKEILTVIDESNLQEKNSFVTHKINSILSYRYKSHEERQVSLKESWKNLDEILKTLS